MNKKSLLSCLINVFFIGLITKVISMSSRIIMSRELGIDAVSIYSLVNPIFIFLITLSSFSLPTAISSLISKYPHRGKKIFITSAIILLLINIPIILAIIFFDKVIAINLLHNIDTIPSIRLLLLVVPLTSISSLIKGYYFAKKEMALASTSSLIEECSRLLSVVFLCELFTQQNNDIRATFFIVVLIIGEIVQTTYLILSSGEKYIKNISKIRDIYNEDNYVFKDVLSISFPLTLSRIVTSFTYMLEPIIITTILINLGRNSNEISLEYGVISSYVMPLLTLPNFFSIAISNFLLPSISSLTGENKYKEAFNLFHKIVLITFVIGIVLSIGFFFFGGELLKIIYHIDQGQHEIKLLSLPFVIYYIETPINITMHALNLSKVSFKSSLICSIIRIILLIILANFFGVIAASFATLISCYLDVILNYSAIVKVFKRHNV